MIKIRIPYTKWTIEILWYKKKPIFSEAINRLLRPGLSEEFRKAYSTIPREYPSFINPELRHAKPKHHKKRTKRAKSKKLGRTSKTMETKVREKNTARKHKRRHNSRNRH